MLDPAILLSLQVPYPPDQPSLVQERVLPSAAGAQVERIGRRMADAFERAADDWLASMQAMRASAEQARLETPTDDDRRLLAELIGDYETLADLRAKRGARLQRRIVRDVKADSRIDPSVAAARKAFGGRIVAVEKRIVDALLDHALFLRAVRADLDPAARGGPTFDTLDDLERHLVGLGAAFRSASRSRIRSLQA